MRGRMAVHEVVLMADVERRSSLGQDETMSPDVLERAESGLRRELAHQSSELRRLRRELEEREEQLRQAQKMEVLGNFAGGIAHDFNNIVLSIAGYATMALQEWPSGQPGREDVEEVLRSAQQAQGPRATGERRRAGRVRARDGR